MAGTSTATKLLLSGSLLYASYLIYKCPCDTVVKCQRWSFYTATLAPVVYVAWCNLASTP